MSTNGKTWVIIAILFALLIVEGVQLYLSIPNAACQEAIAAYQEHSLTLQSALSSLESSYEADVYTRADNINQQILLASENQFGVLGLLALQNDFLLTITTACQ